MVMTSVELTCNRLCRPFEYAGVRLALKVDLSSGKYDLDGEICEGKQTLANYHINVRTGTLFVFRGDALIRTIASGRMSEVLDVIIRDYTKQPQR